MKVVRVVAILGSVAGVIYILMALIAGYTLHEFDIRTESKGIEL